VGFKKHEKVRPGRNHDGICISARGIYFSKSITDLLGGGRVDFYYNEDTEQIGIMLGGSYSLSKVGAGSVTGPASFIKKYNLPFGRCPYVDKIDGMLIFDVKRDVPMV